MDVKHRLVCKSPIENCSKAASKTKRNETTATGKSLGAAAVPNNKFGFGTVPSKNALTSFNYHSAFDDDFVTDCDSTCDASSDTGFVRVWWNGWQPLIETNGVWHFFSQAYAQLASVYVLECGASGDCLFWSIAQGINLWHSQTAQVDALAVRHMAADALNTGNIDAFLQLSMDGGPSFSVPQLTRLATVAQRLQTVQTKIRTMGTMYQGETQTLDALVQHPLFVKKRLGFLVVSDYDVPTVIRKEQKTVLNDSSPLRRGITIQPIVANNDTQDLLMLKNEGGGHWTLLGIGLDVGDNVKQVYCVFPRTGIPDVFRPFVI